MLVHAGGFRKELVYRPARGVRLVFKLCKYIMSSRREIFDHEQRLTTAVSSRNSLLSKP